MNTNRSIELRNRIITIQNEQKSKIPRATSSVLPKHTTSTTTENTTKNQEQYPNSSEKSSTDSNRELPSTSHEQILRTEQERLRTSLTETTALIKQLSIDTNPIDAPKMAEEDQNPQPFNKNMADMMTTHIPKFELNPNTDPALELRSFLRACENVINLFDIDDESTLTEFLQLIKLRLGYNVQERITKTVFKDLKDLENHLRSVCHIKLNKGKLLSEIRNEHQHPDEDVSHFVERLRKLIAQGRSEYPRDKDFEYEAIRTLKNSVKNELISIKLMDSTINVFEDLADVAITRDSELNQRAYNKTLHKNSETNDLMNEILKKIKKLETSNQPATVQNITQENPSPRHETNKSPQRNHIICNYCKKPGHLIANCRIRPRTNNYPHPQRPYQPMRNKNQFRPNYQPNNSNQNLSSSYSSKNPRTNYEHNPYPSNPQDGTNPTLCLRCNQPGHKSPNCYAIICSNCKQIGHLQNQCTQNNNPRRVHFCECTQPNDDYNTGNA